MLTDSHQIVVFHMIWSIVLRILFQQPQIRLFLAVNHILRKLRRIIHRIAQNLKSSHRRKHIHRDFLYPIRKNLNLKAVTRNNTPVFFLPLNLSQMRYLHIKTMIQHIHISHPICICSSISRFSD